MNSRNMAVLSYLDNIRLNRGIDQLRAEFLALCETKRAEAVSRINDKQLFFATLFILMPEIEAFHMFDKLSFRNKCAIRLCSIISKDKKIAAHDEIMSAKNKKNIILALRWMISTGSTQDGLSNDFDEVLDGAASLLINTYNDRTLLPVIAEMIFKRYKNGLFIHDLVWNFFQAKDPVIFKIIVAYLRSNEQKYVELACKLLNIADSDEVNSIQEEQFSRYQDWLDENVSYLYFTDESNLLTSNPQYAKVDYDAKYLQKRHSKTLHPYTKKERSMLEDFHGADEEEKSALSDYSHKLHHQSISSWNRWRRQPINDQIHIARKDGGGTQ